MDFSTITSSINALTGTDGLPVVFAAVMGVVVAIWGFRRAVGLLGR